EDHRGRIEDEQRDRQPISLGLGRHDRGRILRQSGSRGQGNFSKNGHACRGWIFVTRPVDVGARRRAALGTLFFVMLVPGTVVGVVPYLFTRWRIGPPLLGLAALRFVGVALIVLGLPVFLNFIGRFVSEGLGTPAPIAPPRHLVIGGVFRHVRNPGYVAVLAM